MLLLYLIGESIIRLVVLGDREDSGEYVGLLKHSDLSNCCLNSGLSSWVWLTVEYDGGC